MPRPQQQPGTLGNISITSTTNGRWQASAWLCDHQRQRQRLRARAATPDQAVDELRRRADHILNRVATPMQPSMTLGAAIKTWSNITATKTGSLTDRTIRLYQGWGRTITETAGELRLEELTVGSCNALIQRINLEHGIATARSCKKVLSLVLGMAARSDAIAHNFVRDTERLDGAEKIESALTRHGFARLRELVSNWRITQRGGIQPDRDLLEDAICIAIATSARPGEILAIRNRDILDVRSHLGQRTIKVDVCGKIVNVPRVGAVREDRLKRERQARHITLPEFAHPAIDRRTSIVGTAPETLLFATSSGRARSVSNLERLLRTFRNDNRDAIVNELGIPVEEFTWKLFRRTAATIVDEHGGITLASALLGHANQQTTERHYRVRRPEVDPRTAEILNKWSSVLSEIC